MRKYMGFVSFMVLAFFPVCVTAENSIKSRLGIPFGDICIIKAEFIDKPNDYYAQNISKSKYYLKIIEINNNKLSEALIMEPVYENGKFEKNRIYTLRAYETIKSEGEPRGWTDELQQFNYYIKHNIIIQQP